MPCQHPLDSFLHSLLSSNAILAFVYHSLQTQILSGYEDLKLIEMLFYLIQVYSRFDELYGKKSRPLAPCGMLFSFI